MKVEHTDKAPLFNLMKPDGIRSQAHNEVITRVLLNDGRWYDIVPGSFKFYKTSSNGQNPGVPFVQFDYERVATSGENVEYIVQERVEVFPATVAGIAYEVSDEDSDEDNGE